MGVAWATEAGAGGTACNTEVASGRGGPSCFGSQTTWLSWPSSPTLGTWDPLRVALGTADVVLPGVDTVRPTCGCPTPPGPSFSGLWHDKSLGAVLRIEAGEAATTVGIGRRQFGLVGDSDGTAVVPELGLRLVPTYVDGVVVLDVIEGGNPWGRFRPRQALGRGEPGGIYRHVPLRRGTPGLGPDGERRGHSGTTFATRAVRAGSRWSPQ